MEATNESTNFSIAEGDRVSYEEKCELCLIGENCPTRALGITPKGTIDIVGVANGGYTDILGKHYEFRDGVLWGSGLIPLSVVDVEHGGALEALEAKKAKEAAIELLIARMSAHQSLTGDSFEAALSDEVHNEALLAKISLLADTYVLAAERNVFGAGAPGPEQAMALVLEEAGFDASNIDGVIIVLGVFTALLGR